MPTQDDLAGLYDADKTYKTDSDYEVHLTGLIRLTCAAHWALETRDSEYASFLFSNGTRYWSLEPYYVNGRYWGRALPVRSVKQGKAMQKDEEFIALLESAVKENRLDIIPDSDLLEICQRARSIAAFGNTLDIELSETICSLLEEI